MNFFQTVLGRAFYEHHVPKAINPFVILNEHLEKANELKEKELALKERELALKETVNS